MSDITSQPSHVLRPEELPSKDRGGGAKTIPLVTAARGATSYINGITAFEPGAQIAHHTHNVAESVIIISGEAIVDIDGRRTRLRTFDTTFVPANVPHHFENASPTEEMRIFWTYGSVDATRTIVDSGEHGRVDSESAGLEGAPHAVRELATITVRPGGEEAFERAVSQAIPLFQRALGARSLSLDSSVENPARYVLSVTWDSVADHMVSFRQSADFIAWRELIEEHLDRPIEMHHVQNVITGF